MFSIYPEKDYKYYTIYQTTNLINRRQYIGLHKTNSFKSYRTKNYFGSNKLLQEDIKKYGKSNFIREFLFVFDNEKDMLNKEHELVDENIWKNDMYYNETRGEGNPPNQKGKVKSLSHCEKISLSLRGNQLTQEHRKNISKSKKGKCMGKNSYWYGKTFDENHKFLLSESKCGEKHWNSKLTDEEILEIRTKWSTGKYTQKDLAGIFNTSNGNVNHIVNFYGWKKNSIQIYRKGKKGENNGSSKLTNGEVLEIRRLYQEGSVTLKQLGEIYGISISSIYNVVSFQTWKHLK